MELNEQTVVDTFNSFMEQQKDLSKRFTDKQILDTAECCDISGAMEYYFMTESYEGSFEEYLLEQLKWFLDHLNK